MKTIITTLLSATLAISAAAESVPSAPCALRIAAGPDGKVYSRMVYDMQRACGQAASFCPVITKGGVDNMTRLAASEAEMGIVQVDVLREMEPSDPTIKKLQLVLPLHNNLLHVLTLSKGVKPEGLLGKLPFTERTPLTNFSQLQGRRIAAVGSAQLMGQSLSEKLGYGLQVLSASNDREAIAMMQDGKADAVFTLGGWPLPSVDVYDLSSGLALIDFDAPMDKLDYLVVKRNYPKLDAMNFRFLAAPNVLVTRPFKPDGKLGQEVLRLSACLHQRFDELQEGRYQPAWRDVDDLTETHGLTPYGAASSTKLANGSAR